MPADTAEQQSLQADDSSVAPVVLFDGPLSSSQQTAGIVVIMLLVLLAYWPAFSCGFIWDDDAYVTRNDTLRSIAGLYRIWFVWGSIPQYYPLTHTTFWLEFQLWGLNPVGFHVVNVLLHIGTSLILWLILRQIQVPGSWFIAALFAIHPVHAESVVWITERKNVLSGLLYMLTFYLYLPLLDRDETGWYNWRWWLALLVFVLSLMSKTVTASLPAALLLTSWWQTGRVRSKTVISTVPFFCVSLIAGLITAEYERIYVGAEGNQFDWTVAERALIAGRATWFYAAKLLWPLNLTFIYPRWNIDSSKAVQYLYPILALALPITLWGLRHKLGRGPLTAVLFFGGTLIPALGFINVYPMRYSYVADHFQYLASIGLLSLIGGTIVYNSRKVDSAWLTNVLGICILSLLVLLTQEACAKYENLETLWRDTIAKNPHAAIAHHNLGRLLSDLNRNEEALQHLREANRLREHPETRLNLAKLLAKLGKTDEAIAIAKQGTQLKPDYADCHLMLGVLFERKNQFEQAQSHYELAVKHAGNNVQYRMKLAELYLKQKQFPDAKEHFLAALEIDPPNSFAHYSLGMIAIEQRDATSAIKHLRASLIGSPDSAGTHYQLGTVYLAVGDRESAIRHLQIANQLQPDVPHAREMLKQIEQ